MNNFALIAQNVDITPLLLAVKRKPALWKENTIRQDHPGSAHVDTESILLRFSKISSVREIIEDCEAFDYPACSKLPEARPLIFWLMSRVAGERLGRCILVNLKAGGRVTPHVDEGAAADYYDRFHIVLQSNEGNSFRTGDEWVRMRTGDVWWFNNSIEHEVVNESRDDRIHLIVDIRTSHP